MSFAIRGLGTALPPTTISQADAFQIARSLCCRTDEHTTWLPMLYNQTGMNTRHLIFGAEVVGDVLHGTKRSQSIFLPTGAVDDRGPTTGERMEHYVAEAGPLAVRAARQALRSSGLAPSELTHLITVSCTGFHAPGVDVELIKALELPATIERMHVGYMGCHGAINGLRAARAHTGADPDARVLLCAVELCSLHYHYGWDPQKMVANALFADGAAAVVGVPQAAAPERAWCVAATGSCVFPGAESAMTWTVGDHGFEMTLSKRVPELIALHLRPWLEGWLRKNRLDLEEMASWAVHPGGPRILSSVEEALDLGPTALATSREVLAECGNMSSPTVLFILDRLCTRQAPRPCLALAFGPGLTVEAALFR